MLEFQVTKGQGLWRTDKNIVSADATDIQAHFTLTADFSGTITAWWRRSDKPGSTWTSTLSNGQCTIPAEALSATDKAVCGPHDHFVYVSISDTGRTTSAECEIRVQRSAFSTTATPGTGGNPTAYEELVKQFDELKEENQTFKDDMTEQLEKLNPLKPQEYVLQIVPETGLSLVNYQTYKVGKLVFIYALTINNTENNIELTPGENFLQVVGAKLIPDIGRLSSSSTISPIFAKASSPSFITTINNATYTPNRVIAIFGFLFSN